MSLSEKQERVLVALRNRERDYPESEFTVEQVMREMGWPLKNRDITAIGVGRSLASLADAGLIYRTTLPRMNLYRMGIYGYAALNERGL
jgi:hypothetical protein